MKPEILAYAFPAYAFPYDRVHLAVFLDRVGEGHKPELVPRILAYVLANEIANMWKAPIGHSDTR